MTLNLDALRERYLRAQLAGDRREAVRVVVEDGLGEGVSPPALRERVIAAAQTEIGRLWQLNLVSVAQEHMASAISQLALASLFERSKPGAPVGKRVVVACVEGELHDLPPRMVADALEHAGFDVDFLGANVPQDDLVKFVSDTKPDLVCLSVTMSFHLQSFRRAVAAVRAATSAPILAGGHAIAWSPSVVTELAVLTCDPNPDALVATVRAAAGLPPA